jgi:spore coat protein U-like protein
MKLNLIPLAATFAAALSAAALAPSAQAATASGSLNLSITIQASCTVVSASAVAFGSVATIPANIDQTSTLVVNCSNTTPYTVSLGVGNGSGATTAVRKLTSGANTVNYSLFRDAARTQVWGTTIGTDTVAGTGNGANQNISIFARVPTQAVPAPGAYTDTVAVTITY